MKSAMTGQAGHMGMQLRRILAARYEPADIEQIR
jgi:hypothetical protein